MKSKLTFASLLLAGACLFSSCGEEGGGTGGASAPSVVEPSTARFVVMVMDPGSTLAGGIEFKVFRDLSNESRSGVRVLGQAGSFRGTDASTQQSWNPQSKVYTTYVYRGSSADQQFRIRTYTIGDNDSIRVLGTPIEGNAFGNTGTFGKYSYCAQPSQPTVARIDEYGAVSVITVSDLVTNYSIDEVNPQISGLTGRADNDVVMSLYYSNRDSAAVAFVDNDLRVKSVAYDPRLGGAMGAWRSVRYPVAGVTDSGDFYYFCGNSANNGHVGALRVRGGATAFDANYMFNILSASGGYRFRAAYYVTGTKFLFEFYADASTGASPQPGTRPEAKSAIVAQRPGGGGGGGGSSTALATGGRYAIVDVEAQTLTWVSGLPTAADGTVRWGDNANGFYYVPFYPAAGSTFKPAIYKIDASTGRATTFMTFADGEQPYSFKILK